MQCIEYSSNNSGGSFWLSNDDWLALEAAGWEVDWVRDNPRYEGDTWLGTPAMYARRFGVSERVAIAEFEDLTGQDANDKGCSCCGAPHYFYEGDAEPRTLKVQAEQAEPVAPLPAPAKVNVIANSVRSRRATCDNLITGGHEFEERTEGRKTTFVVTVPAGYEFSIVVPK